MKDFYKTIKNALKRGRRKEQKKEEPAADIDRKQAHEKLGEYRCHFFARLNTHILKGVGCKED